ncbi:hypothetical protein [Taibaiella chishuiensis]|uniref:Peptidase MA superfamily protein n=1 Tax=Taibaiella chishuiensis TaxID=1434707 RepID=A0A2P8CWE0_9BACT|nr:hypothetical protein [Taibaiella chishuiensis]PSK89260.1 hypothetical protein B0I18_11261 [Taibaiella chishuiensis]
MKPTLPRILFTMFTVLVAAGLTARAQQHLYCNPPVAYNPRTAMLDTADRTAILHAIDAFFATKNQSPSANAWWLAADFARYRFPYRDLYEAELSPRLQDSLHFRPTLLELIPAGTDTCLAKVAFMGQEAGGFSSLKFIYNILVTRQQQGFRLSRITDYHTRSWKRYTAGTIRFIVSPGRTYNPQEAQRLDSMNRHYAALLQLPVVQATYYSCTGSVEMFGVKGYDYVPNMYVAESGGQADADAHILYSALNTEWYPHELVHLYIDKLAGDQGGYLAKEGACTFLAGSLNLPLSRHAQALLAYSNAHPEQDLYDLLFNEKQVTGTTSSVYGLGGIIAAAVYDRYGLRGLQEWLQTGDSPAAVLQFLDQRFKTGDAAGVSAWLKKQLQQVASKARQKG